MNIDAATERRLYQLMLRIRLVEERIADLYPEQEMRCPVHLSIGQEAAAAGVCAALGPEDKVFSGHRSHGHYIAIGGNLKAMFAELYGKATGCVLGKGGSMHLVDLKKGFLGATPIVGSTIPIAVGVAFAARMRREDRVVVSFFGEAAVEEGVFHEAANFAVLKSLPVVFSCENNLYSTQSPLSVRQPAGRQIFAQAASYGMESHQADGNDAIEVYRLARAAVEKARTGGGPTFLELMTYRWREHVGPNYDNDLGYRTEAEFLEWKARDPVESLLQHMIRCGRMSREDAEVMAKSINVEIDEAVAFAKSSPFPDESLLLADIYAK